MLGGKCSFCGYKKCLASLDFHHKNPKNKNLDGRRLYSHSWNKILKEIKKCILLCANCHREYHWKKGVGITVLKKAKKYLKEKFK